MFSLVAASIKECTTSSIGDDSNILVNTGTWMVSNTAFGPLKYVNNYLLLQHMPIRFVKSFMVPQRINPNDSLNFHFFEPARLAQCFVSF